MSRSSYFLRQPFIDALRSRAEGVCSFLEKKLTSETDPYKRVSCMEILMANMDAMANRNEDLLQLLKPDLQSPHINLKIAAIRAAGYYKNPQSTKLLLPLLQDPAWEVRAVCARSLGYLQSLQALEPLSHLCRDSTWWVRMNAALALKRYGPRGIELLQSQQPDQDRFAYETAQYVLALEDDELI